MTAKGSHKPGGKRQVIDEFSLEFIEMDYLDDYLPLSEISLIEGHFRDIILSILSDAKGGEDI